MTGLLDSYFSPKLDVRAVPAKGVFSVPLQPSEPADYVNHSCQPNAGLSGQIVLLALRDIAAGEEVCYDYATSDSCPYHEFECACGSPQCRGWVTGSDWKRPELWERYADYVSPYLQRRIALLKQGLADEAGEVLFEFAEPPRLKREQP